MYFPKKELVHTRCSEQEMQEDRGCVQEQEVSTDHLCEEIKWYICVHCLLIN